MMETPEGRKDFNTRTGREEYWNKRHEELHDLVDPATGILYKDCLEYRTCPLCGRDDSFRATTLFVKEGLPITKCPSCSMVYTNPFMRQDVLERTYETSQSMSAWLRVLESQEDLDRAKFEYMLGHIEKHLPEDVQEPRLLDVGGSYGFFCYIAKEWNYKPVGLELSREAYEIYSRRFVDDFPMLRMKLEEFKAPYGFDIVTFWEVLEHIPDPGALLEEARGHIRDGGLLAVLVPNVNSRTAQILHEKAKMFGANHLNYWNIDTLTRQLDQAGFDVLHHETLIGDVNTWWNYIHFEEPYSGNLVHPDHEEATRRTLARGEGYKLFVVAKKREGASS